MEFSFKMSIITDVELCILSVLLYLNSVVLLVAEFLESVSFKEQPGLQQAFQILTCVDNTMC